MGVIGYKFRSNTNLNKKGRKRDVETLCSFEIYASAFTAQNDPFETSVNFPAEYRNEWVTNIKRNIYNYGLYSLTLAKENEEFPSNELMWSHYADSHSGFCIAYDLGIIESICKSNTFDLVDGVRIKYDADRPELKESEHLCYPTILQKVFGTKSLAWEYENEYRLIFNSIGSKKISSNAISAIYFGLNMPLDERQYIISKLKGHNIDFYQMEHINNTYKLKATKINMEYQYKILSKKSVPACDNYMILYLSDNKDENSLREFVGQFRKSLTRPSNITVIDDISAEAVLNNYKPCNLMTKSEIEIQAEHWIAYSTFDAPDVVWCYPEK